MHPRLSSPKGSSYHAPLRPVCHASSHRLNNMARIPTGQQRRCTNRKLFQNEPTAQWTKHATHVRLISATRHAPGAAYKVRVPSPSKQVMPVNDPMYQSASSLNRQPINCRAEYYLFFQTCSFKTAWLAADWVNWSAHGKSKWAGLTYIG